MIKPFTTTITLTAKSGRALEAKYRNNLLDFDIDDEEECYKLGLNLAEGIIHLNEMQSGTNILVKNKFGTGKPLFTKGYYYTGLKNSIGMCTSCQQYHVLCGCHTKCHHCEECETGRKRAWGIMNLGRMVRTQFKEDPSKQYDDPEENRLRDENGW